MNITVAVDVGQMPAMEVCAGRRIRICDSAKTGVEVATTATAAEAAVFINTWSGPRLVTSSSMLSTPGIVLAVGRGTVAASEEVSAASVTLSPAGVNCNILVICRVVYMGRGSNTTRDFLARLGWRGLLSPSQTYL